jgi:putative ABC transport system substrate-binding protein
MRRRDFIVIGGVAATWPLVAGAQQTERVRRIGVILPSSSDDSEYQSWFGAFLQALAQLDWVIGRNVRLDDH